MGHRGVMPRSAQPIVVGRPIALLTCINDATKRRCEPWWLYSINRRRPWMKPLTGRYATARR